MSNGIGARQNEKNSIAMLAAQRQLYSDVKMYDWSSIVLSVWIPLGLAIILIFTHDNEQWTFVSYVLSIISMFFSMVIDSYIIKKKELAAFIQQKFDTYVYIMPWDSRIFGKEKNVNHEVAIYSKKILDDDVQKMKLTDWYTPIVDELSLEDGILACQRENFSWDVGLRKRFRIASIIIISVLCVAILVIGVWKNETVVKLICRLAFIVPMLQWLSGTVKQINRDIKTLDELDENINSSEAKTMEDLQDIQKVIFDHRKRCFTIPNYFYKAFKNNDEDREHRIATLN